MDTIQKIHSIFDQYAERIFLIEATTDRQFTYFQFYQYACLAARILYAQGIRPQDRVALLLTNSAEFAALYFGCLFLGVVAVPINPSLHQREVSFILTHSGIKLIICSPTTRKLISETIESTPLPVLCLLPVSEQAQLTDQAGALSFEMISAPEIPDWQPLDKVSDEHLFSITFTSGTTSVPKGVAHRVSNLFENAITFNQAMGCGPDNRFLHVMTMAYMAGFLNTLLCPFTTGASVVLAHPFDAQTMLNFWQPITHYSANTFWLSPTMLTALLRVDRDPTGPIYCREYVKAVFVGTAPLPLKTKKDFEHKYGVELLESYGLSELLLVSGNSKYFPRLDGSVGQVIPGVEVKIRNEQGDMLRIGMDGEILIRTPYIMAGYLDYQTLEPDPIPLSDWFPTGDIGHLDSNGYLFITGRKKDLIIRGGINISPRAVEEVLLEHKSVDRVAVIGLPHEFYGEEVVAVIQFKSGYSLTEEQKSLQELCKKNLATSAVPTRFFTVTRFPTSSTDKIQKHKLREQLIGKG